ncbi:MAG: cache domain-containing protein [Candidatus Competibacterales bacterium]
MNTASEAVTPEQLKNIDPRGQGSLRLRLLPVLVGVLTLLLAAFLYAFYQDQLQQRQGERQAAQAALSTALNGEMRSDIAKLSTAMEAIIRDKPLADAFQRQDREALTERGQPLFERLRDQHQVTHFYFHRTNHHNLLRLHKSQRDDLIDRNTIKTADNTNQPTVGLEQGPTGNPVLRYVYPWRSDFPVRSDSNYYQEPLTGELIGFLELGIEFTDIARRVSDQVGMDLIVSVDKQFLDQGRWEGRNKRIGKQSNWDEFPDTVVMDKTLGAIPASISATMAQFAQADQINGQNLRYNDGEAVYQVVAVPLEDMNQAVVGNVIALNDITELLANSQNAMVFTALVCVLIGALLTALFWMFLGRIEQDLKRRSTMLTDTYQQLVDTNRELRQSEAREREKAQQLEASLVKLQQQRGGQVQSA